MYIHTYIPVLEIRIRNWSAVFEDRIFYRLLIAVPLKMYGKFGQPKWIVVGQILKLVRKWPMADLFLALTYVCTYVHMYTVLYGTCTLTWVQLINLNV